MQILINLNLKWNKGNVTVTPIPSEPIIPPIEVLSPVEPTDVQEVIEFTDEFYRLVRDPLVNDIKLDEGKIYIVNRIRVTNLRQRKLRIHSDSKRATIIFGVENYTPILHGPQDGFLFMMQHDSELIIDNVNICQPKQLKTVQYFNPRILNSLAQSSVKFTAVIRNCDTTVMGNNGGFGIGFVYGHTEENHVALINFKHYGVGLMDAKNPYTNGITYVTMRDVDAYAREDANLSKTDFEHTATLKDGILTFDGSVYQFTSGYNWNWKDNDSYIVLHDRYTFFIDGFKSETVVSDNQFRIRPQANGLTKLGIWDKRTVYSNEVEMHAGDKFIYNNIEYTILSKDRHQYEWFDSRTTHCIAVPERERGLRYVVDKDIQLPQNYKNYGRAWVVERNGVVVRDNFDNVVNHYILLNRITDTNINREDIFLKALGDSYIVYNQITVDYRGTQINFTESPITLLYKANSNFNTTINTKYRESPIMFGRGIGHLSYNHSDISMDAINVKHLGFYRGSEKGNGKSIIWNLYNCEGFEDSGVWFKTAIPLTNIADLPLHHRIQNIL
jgi:hypothetical protein